MILAIYCHCNLFCYFFGWNSHLSRPKQIASWWCLDPTFHGSSGAVDPWEAAPQPRGPRTSRILFLKSLVLAGEVSSIPLISVVKVIEGPSFTPLRPHGFCHLFWRSRCQEGSRCGGATEHPSYPVARSAQDPIQGRAAGCWVLGCPCLMWSQETMSRNITFHRVGQGKNDWEWVIGDLIMAYYGLKYVNSIEFPPGIQDGLLIFDPFFFPASHVWLPKGSWIVEGPSPLYNRSVVIHDMPDQPRYFSEKKHCCWVVYWGNGLDGYFSRNLLR